MVELFGVTVPVIYAHLGALLVLFVLIVTADAQATAWMRGTRQTLSLSTLRRVHVLVWTGLIVMIVSGLLMAWPLAGYLVTSPAFYAKLFFVLALVGNSFFIGASMRVASEKPFANLTPEERRRVLVSGAVSTICWVGAFVAALFMTTSNWLQYFLSQLF